MLGTIHHRSVNLFEHSISIVRSVNCSAFKRHSANATKIIKSRMLVNAPRSRTPRGRKEPNVSPIQSIRSNPRQYYTREHRLSTTEHGPPVRMVQ